MHITTKLVLQKHRTRKDSTCPVAMRFTVGRKSHFVSTRQYVDPENWRDDIQNVRKGVPNYRDLHLFFETWKSNVLQAILMLKQKKMEVTHKSIMNLINHGEQSDDFIEFVAKELAENSKKYSPGTLRHYKSKLNMLKVYQNPINVHLMDYNFLKNYKIHLESLDSIDAYSTVHAHLKFIRAMNNEAIRQGLTDNYAFKNFTLPDPKSTGKAFLSREERDILWALLYAGSLPGYLQKVLHFFLIACYTGIRESDWRQCRNVEGEDVLVVKQTKKKGAIVRIPLNKFSKQLINDLPSNYRVFSNFRNNKYLKEIMQIANIKKHMTTHCARHTFVVMCLNEAKIPFKMVAEFVDDSVKTLEKHYAKYLDSYKKDEMNKLNDL